MSKVRLMGAERRESEYAPTSSFQSCPAATGVARPTCMDFPDGAHRCSKERAHVATEVGHACTCGYGWMSSTINDGHMPPAPAPTRRIRPDALGDRREGNTL